jgi:hypothetical protein
MVDLSLRFDFDGQRRGANQQNQERGLVVVAAGRAARVAGAVRTRLIVS